MEMTKLDDVINNGYYHNQEIILIVTAGFEDRDIAVVKKFKTSSIKINKIIILDYENCQDNEPMRSNIINTSKSISESFKLLPINQLFTLTKDLPSKHKIAVDITGMSRLLIFQILNLLDKIGRYYDILYTEAEVYYPLKLFYDELVAGDVSKEKAFSRYLDLERTEIVYSYDCDIVQPNEFEGCPEPGKPALLLAFFAFKRSRLQIILQYLELEKKVFILSEPVRSELKWRKDLMEIVNFDLVKKNKPFVVIQDTLDPIQIMHFIEGKTYANKDYARYNLILAPLGSKMQTVGSYFYWRKHPDVSVIFSQPQSYFRDKYSESSKDTFILPSDLIREKTKFIPTNLDKCEV
jgi:hypothetical protein